MYASSYFNLTSVKFWFGNDKYLKLFANLNKGKYEEDKKIGIQL